MKIGILGSRGIPNNYGGFEQFAEYISKGLTELGHEVIVYNTHNHTYKNNVWNKVKIIHKYNPETRIGNLGQFLYDFNCILSARKENFDIVLQLGYTSSSIWARLLPKDAIIITNMDGLEWKRSKYSKLAKFFLKYAERWATESSHYLIADSICIEDYLNEKYNKPVQYIPYGANIVSSFNSSLLIDYGLEEQGYYITIARIEPENNIDLILTSFLDSKSKAKMVVIGDFSINRYGKHIFKKFSKYENILFTGGIYNITALNTLRHYAKIYFHGHSVGGTNPSLLEAMASQVLIAAHDNKFNQAIIGNDGLYFSQKEDIIKIIKDNHSGDAVKKVENNIYKIKNTYNWQSITNSYNNFFNKISL